MPNPTPEDLLGLSSQEGQAGGLDKFLNQPGSSGGRGWGMLMMLQSLMADPGYAPFAAHIMRQSRVNSPEGQYYNQNLNQMLQSLWDLKYPPPEQGLYGQYGQPPKPVMGR